MIERFDEAGRLIERRELAGDGEKMGRHVWDRDDDGRIVRHAVAELGDRLKYYFDYRYDDLGREVRRDYGFFAEPGPFRRWTTTYAPDGRTASRVRSRIADGKVHSTVQLTYDDRSLLVRRRTLDANGEQDRITEWTYDGDSRVVEERDDWQGNRHVTTWRYADGHLVERTRDDGADGSVDQSTTYDYGCW